MTTPVAVLGQATWNQLLSTFRQWVRDDMFVSRQLPQASQTSDSFHTLRSYVTTRMHMSQELKSKYGAAPVKGLSMTMREFLAQAGASGPRASSTLSNAEILQTLFLTPCIKELLLDVLYPQAQAHGSGPEAHSEAVVAVLNKVEKLVDSLFEPECLEQCFEAMLDVLRQERGDAPLWELYRAERDGFGFYNVNLNYTLGSGPALKPLMAKTAQGPVKVELARFQLEGDAGVRAYEWRATLTASRADGSGEYCAAAAQGVVFIPIVKQGFIDVSEDGLLWAADQISDPDLGEMYALFEQHPGAVDLLRHGGLCTLSAWERHPEASKGVGAEMLKAAMVELKKRFSDLFTLVLNVSPAHLLGPAPEGDPSEYILERHDSSEGLQNLLESMKLNEVVAGEVLYIMAGPRETALALLEIHGSAELV